MVAQAVLHHLNRAWTSTGSRSCIRKLSTYENCEIVKSASW
jgi:hypothetical protein